MSPFIYQFNKNYNPFSDPPRVNVHPFLLDYREEAYNTNAYEPELVQDNPVFHNSLQTILHSRWHIAKGVNVDANLLLEQQGHSFGIYNSARTFISPQVRLEIDRDLRFFKQDFNFRGAVGTFRDFRLNEGLILYNYGLQGLDLSLGWKRLRFRYVQINDMWQWIGLRMQEPIFINLQLDSLPLGSKWKADLGGTLFAAGNLYGPSFRAGFQRGPGLRLYLEAGMTLNDEDIPIFSPRTLKDEMALVAGARWNFQKGPLTADLRAEFRYYGNWFLFRRKAEWVGYIGGDAELVGFSGRKVREHFYPLHYMDRPFAQFALFADFYNNGGSLTNLAPDVGAAILNADLRLALRHGLFLQTVLDFNLLFVENADPFLYPFFRAGFGWEIVEGNRLSIGLSNKAMDYQLHYPTHQWLERPHFFLNATRDLPHFQKNTWR